ncbi:MAG: hypothetical protein ACI3V0_06270 [Faecousia sp.]
MKRILVRLLCAVLAVLLILSITPVCLASDDVISLSGYIRSSEKRHFVESMLSFHLRENTTVQKTLKEGNCAVFFFEGCSDNMDDSTLSDLSYYRVSAVCIVLKLDEQEKPEIIYFHPDCSTLPDRPLEYGAWELEEVGKVGPATICDGTYELYSVYHAGAYEALHLRTSYEDDTIAAVYMTPDGFVTSAATAINVHTRTGNHVIEKAMWSAGCLLVGDGVWEEYADLIVKTYYSQYEKFAVDQKVGCITVNRQHLQQQMYELYENQEAVDTLLVSSRCELPQVYLERCQETPEFTEKTVQTTAATNLMSLPCTNSVDARSIPVIHLEKGEKIDICGSLVNAKGQLWYEVSFVGENCYIPAGNVEDLPPTLMEQIWAFFRKPGR